MMANGGADNPPFRAVLSAYSWIQAFMNASTAESNIATLLLHPIAMISTTFAVSTKTNSSQLNKVS